MIDAARVGGLAIEAADRVGVLHHARMHHLESALAAHLHVLGQVHLAHAAFAELAHHVIAVGDDRADEIRLAADRAQRRSVARTEPLARRIFGVAGRANLQWTTHDASLGLSSRATRAQRATSRDLD